MRQTCAALAVILAVCCGTALAAQPAAKATAKVGEIAILDATELEETTILANRIKSPNGKDLFIDVSLECGMFTRTKVDSMGGIEDRAEAEAGVEVRVLVDGVEALPGPVTFCRRSQILKAEFQGLLTDDDGNLCIVDDVDNPGTLILDVDCLRPETLEMVLDTMGSHSFNFIFPDLTSGEHDVEVRAKIDTFIESTLYSGTKIRDKDIFGDNDENFEAGDTVLTVEKSGKIEIGQVLVIDEEQLLVTDIQDEGVPDPDGKELVVVRGMNGTSDVYHAKATLIYVVDGADAYASIGHGSVTVELVRMIRNEDVELTE